MENKNYKDALAAGVRAAAQREKGLIEVYKAIDEIKVSRTSDQVALPLDAKHPLPIAG